MSPSKMQSGARLAGLAFASLFSVGALAQDDPAARKVAPTREAAVHERIVRAAYDRLQRYAQGSGKDIAFELSAFRDYAPAEFARVPWRKLVDLPSGALIDMLRERQQNDFTRWVGVVYKPTWTETDAAQAPSRRGTPDLADASVAKVLDLVSAEQPELRQMLALTGYTVTVSMDGRSRSYRAAFAWLPATLMSTHSFMVADTIVQGVQESAQERLPPAGSGDVLRGLTNTDEVQPGGPTCSPYQSSTTNESRKWGDADHLFGWGQHTAEAKFQVDCSCTSDCASVCAASITDSTCSDSGVTSLYCHKMSGNAATNTNRKDYNNGTGVGAGCAAGFSCTLKNCVICFLCDAASITVSVAGAEVTFGSSGDADWTQKMEYSRVCSQCVPNTTGGGGTGGGGGGGGTGGGGYCSGGTLYNFDCGNDGSWDYVGECVSPGQNASAVGCDLCFGAGVTGPQGVEGRLAPGTNYVYTCSGLRAGATAAANMTVNAVPTPLEALDRR